MVPMQVFCVERGKESEGEREGEREGEGEREEEMSY